ncbi:arabinogalactan endo-1,4-beta-galactosidase [Trametes punicea]|nr:arabinogalactan endo-1,4-beta-galactosidase [Trametes punicea]
MGCYACSGLDHASSVDSFRAEVRYIEPDGSEHMYKLDGKVYGSSQDTMLALLPFLLLSVAWVTSALNYKGADISSLTVVESSGVHFTDNGQVTPFETILRDHGTNTARIRVWTAGQYDLQYGLALAKRVKAAGMTLVVDLHYSDTWADPGHQAIPAGWPTDLDGLNTQIWQYTKDVVTAYSEQGTPIDILQVGNEINDGLLWPVGRISVNGIDPVSQLLHSAINGAASAGNPRILIHLANGWDWSGLNSFFGQVFIPGALSADQVDIIGVSFYPFYDSGATLSALQSSLTNLANAYEQPIVIAETDWPVSCPGVQLTEPSIPVSVSGQETWVNDIKNILDSLPNGKGQGIFYWEPGWVGSAALGSACADNLLVSSNGATRDSINIFSRDM